jgi:hypothetical protein
MMLSFFVLIGCGDRRLFGRALGVVILGISYVTVVHTYFYIAVDTQRGCRILKINRNVCLNVMIQLVLPSPHRYGLSDPSTLFQRVPMEITAVGARGNRSLENYIPMTFLSYTTDKLLLS